MRKKTPQLKEGPPGTPPPGCDTPGQWEHLAPAWSRLSLFHRLTILPFYVPIRLYQRFVSPHTPPSCRFTPSCSQYATLALRKYGLGLGLLMALWRILRCNPWGGWGHDPP